MKKNKTLKETQQRIESIFQENDEELRNNKIKNLTLQELFVLEDRLEEVENSICLNDKKEIVGSHPLYEMAHKGDTSNGIEIWVYSKERPTPHIHFVKKRGDNKTGVYGCLSLKDASYFNHGEKHKATLNSGELADMIEYLSDTEKDEDGFSTGLTNYESCCKLWNYNNDRYRMKKQDMPDYSVLVGQKR